MLKKLFQNHKVHQKKEKEMEKSDDTKKRRGLRELKISVLYSYNLLKLRLKELSIALLEHYVMQGGNDLLAFFYKKTGGYMMIV